MYVACGDDGWEYVHEGLDKFEDHLIDVKHEY
jgi:hypothetical protein